MRRSLGIKVAAVAGVALLAAVTLAAPASARKFQMSGNWIIRNGQVFIPLQFALTAGQLGLPAGQMTHFGMGNLSIGTSGALFFPNGPVPGGGGVSAMGSAPATVTLPMNRFVGDFMAGLPLAGVGLAQITTNFGVDAPYQAVNLQKSAGPGAFTWCPTDPLCLDKAGTMRTSDPPQGSGTRNGRLIYKAGANQFGGVMQMGLLRGGVNSRIRAKLGPVTYQVQHVFFGGGPGGLRNLAPGGLGSADNPATEMVYLKAGFATQPLSWAMGKMITQPGPKVTTMNGLTNTGTGPILYSVNGTSVSGVKFQTKTSNYGFAHTTGTIIAQQTQGTGGDDFFTWMGYDKRTALGAGALQTIAGGISFRVNVVGTTPYTSLHRVRMIMGAPIPSMSPAGFAAAGSLLLLAAGYALRRRLR